MNGGGAHIFKAEMALWAGVTTLPAVGSRHSAIFSRLHPDSPHPISPSAGRASARSPRPRTGAITHDMKGKGNGTDNG